MHDLPKTGHCVLKDDVAGIMAKVKESEVVVFATPIYYYEMCGQMKTLLDRLNPLYESDYKFRDIYMLATAADDDAHAIDKATTVCRLGRLFREGRAQRLCVRQRYC